MTLAKITQSANAIADSLQTWWSQIKVYEPESLTFRLVTGSARLIGAAVVIYALEYQSDFLASILPDQA
jgi:hypothetical protein